MKQHLQEQFNSTYNTTTWFVSFQESVKNLTVAQANEKINDAVHSIHEIVNHLTFWNQRYLYKFRNEKLKDSVENNLATFQNSENLNWEELLTKANQNFKEWQTELEKTNEETFSSNNKENWSATIGYITHHNAYHIGQIVLLRKLQGSWGNENGVK